MSETTLRWKGRLGSLKGAAVLVLIVAVILFIVALGDLSIAASNPATPQTVKIGQLVDGEFGADRYVSVSGLAFLSEFYKKTEDGKTVEQYYFVEDEATGDMILVESAEKLPLIERQEQVTISGMTRHTESKLRDLIESDLDEMRQAGVLTSAVLYLGEQEKPAGLAESALLVGGLLVLIVLCVATFFFPSTAFGPCPIEFAAAQSAVGEAGVKATGRFQRLATVDPSITVGKGTRQFDNGIANILPLDDGSVLIYIHYVLTRRAYGAQVGKSESDWGIFLDKSHVQDVEPGKVYGWSDRLAVRVSYREADAAPSGKLQMLFVTFNHAAAQQDFANLLRQRGFVVGTGDAPAI
jgi:hypothetical protein